MRAGRRAVFILTAAALLVLSAGPLTAAAVYDVTPLAAPGGTFRPSQINDHRDVVGNNGGHPALWLPQAKYGLGAGANNLSTQTGFSFDSAFGINNHGQIVGAGHPTFTAMTQPVVWLPSPAYGRPAGWSVVAPVSGDVSRISDAGEMAGHMLTVPEPAAAALLAHRLGPRACGAGGRRGCRAERFTRPPRPQSRCRRRRSSPRGRD
jgi:hypothetical protein